MTLQHETELDALNTIDDFQKYKNNITTWNWMPLTQ